MSNLTKKETTGHHVPPGRLLVMKYSCHKKTKKPQNLEPESDQVSRSKFPFIGETEDSGAGKTPPRECNCIFQNERNSTRETRLFSNKSPVKSEKRGTQSLKSFKKQNN